MSDFKVNSIGDIDLTNFEFSLVTSSLDEIAQRLLIKLRTTKGELFYNTAAGVSYFQDILGKNKNLGTVESVLKEAIITVDGVKKLLEFAMTYEQSTRTLSVSFLVQIYTDEELALNGIEL